MCLLLIENDPVIQKKIVEAFGDAITTDGKTISREKLAALVFANTESRHQLNALLHPAIIAEVGRQCTALQDSGHTAVLVEAALIGESGAKDPWIEALILVLASEEIRIERLMQFRNFTREEAQRRIAAQTPPEKKAVFADWVIDNNGDQKALQTRVLQVAKEILKQQ